MMGHNDPQKTWHEDSQQVQNHSNGRPRVGLTPTEGHDAYKRSSARSSKRSRLERTSYLMATGHLDLEETRHLNGSNGNRTNNNNNAKHKNLLSDDSSVFRANNNGKSSPLTVVTPMQHQQQQQQYQQQHYRPGPSGGDQALLEQFSPSNPFNTHDNIFVHNKGSSNKSRGSSKQGGNKDSRGQFRQTYTEISLPMKTSPAFEYILKDNRRRNRRCCLWLVYSTIVTICLAVIIFCTVQLILQRNQI